jgi:hypothetical protein
VRRLRRRQCHGTAGAGEDVASRGFPAAPEPTKLRIELSLGGGGSDLAALGGAAVDAIGRGRRC